MDRHDSEPPDTLAGPQVASKESEHSLETLQEHAGTSLSANQAESGDMAIPELAPAIEVSPTLSMSCYTVRPLIPFGFRHRCRPDLKMIQLSLVLN